MTIPMSWENRCTDLPPPVLFFLKILFLILPILAVAVPYGLPAWLMVATVCTLFIFRKKIKIRSLALPWNGFAAMGGLCLIWMGLSCFWAPSFATSFKLFGALSILYIGGLTLSYLTCLLSRQDLMALMTCCVIGFIIALIFLIIELNTVARIRLFIKQIPRHLYPGYALNAYSMGISLITLLTWPVCYFLKIQEKKWPFLLTPCVLYLSSFFESHAACIGMALGIISFLCVYCFRKYALWAGGICVMVFLVFSPQLTLRYLDPMKIETILPKKAKASYIHRLWIWRYAAHRALEKPLTGWGLNSSRDPTLNQGLLWHSKVFNIPKGSKGLSNDTSSCVLQSLPLHPHNMSLQLWLELGAIGVILFSAFLAGIPLWIARTTLSKVAQATCAGLYANAVWIGLTAFGFWQNWWISGLLIITCLMTYGTSLEQIKNPRVN